MKVNGSSIVELFPSAMAAVGEASTRKANVRCWRGKVSAPSASVGQLAKLARKMEKRAGTKLDEYPTPHFAIEDLLDRETFQGEIWEPAQGNARIVEALIRRGYDAFGTDIQTGTDFLIQERIVPNVITNPPHCLKDEFVGHAQELASEKIAMLLPLEFLHGQRRHGKGLLQNPQFPLKAVYWYVARLKFVGNKSANFPSAWFVWDRAWQGPPMIQQIDNRNREPMTTSSGKGRPQINGRGVGTPRRPFIYLSDVNPQPVDWGWRLRLARGELTIFEGDSGDNKSCVLTDLAARVSTGRPTGSGWRRVSS